MTSIMTNAKWWFIVALIAVALLVAIYTYVGWWTKPNPTDKENLKLKRKMLFRHGHR